MPTDTLTQPSRPAKPGLTLGFSLAGILVIVYAARTDPVWTIPLSAQFGLLQILPPAYWIGLGLMSVGVGLAASSRSDALFVTTGALLLGVFAVTTTLFEPNPSVRDSYLHFANAELINRLGRLPTDPTNYAANWPGFFIDAAFADALGGVAPLQFIGLFPLFSGLITFAALFIFARSFFPSAVARPASIVAALLCVWAQFHTSPQGIGLALALLVLGTAWDRRVPIRAANAILFLGLVLSHATSTIFVLAFFGADLIFVSALPRAWRARAEGALPLRYNPFAMYATGWLGWLFFAAAGTAETARTAVVSQIGQILQLGAKTETVVTERTLANIFVWGPRVRLAALAVFGLASLVALMVAYRHKPSRSRVRFFVASIAALAVLALADILFLGAQLYDRALMFFAILAPCLSLYSLGELRVRPAFRRAVFAILLVGSLAAATTMYYKEALNLVPNQVTSAASFYGLQPGQVLVLGEILPPPVWTLDREPPPWTQMTFGDAGYLRPGEFRGSTAVLAGFDPTTKLWYDQGLGVNIYRYYVAQQANYSLIYDNGFVQAYLLYSPSQPP